MMLPLSGLLGMQMWMDWGIVWRQSLMYPMEFGQGEGMDSKVAKYHGLGWVDDGMPFTELRRKEEQPFGENESWNCYICRHEDRQLIKRRHPIGYLDPRV